MNFVFSFEPQTPFVTLDAFDAWLFEHKVDGLFFRVLKTLGSALTVVLKGLKNLGMVLCNFSYNCRPLAQVCGRKDAVQVFFIFFVFGSVFVCALDLCCLVTAQGSGCRSKIVIAEKCNKLCKICFGFHTLFVNCFISVACHLCVT